MCMMSNEVPQMFDWDQEKNQPGDRWSRPELNSPVVEFLAPTEYMVRPPQPTVYAFLIDVSHAAVASGTFCRLVLVTVELLRNGARYGCDGLQNFARIIGSHSQ